MYKNILHKYVGGFYDSYQEEEIIIYPHEENDIIITRVFKSHIEDYINLTAPELTDKYLRKIVLSIIHCYRLSYIERKCQE